MGKVGRDPGAPGSAFYRWLVDVLGDGVVVHAADGRMVVCNAAAERILGVSADQVAGRAAIEPARCAVWEDGSAVEPESHPVAVALATGQSVRDVVMGFPRSDGSVTWVLCCAEPMVDPSTGGLRYVVASMTDITGVREERDAVDRDRARFQMLAENAADIVFRVGLDGVMEWISPSVTRVTGWGPEELVGSPAWSLVHPDDLDRAVAGLVDVARRAPAQDFRLRIRLKDGSFHWMSAVGQSITESGEVAGVVVGLRDVDEQVRAGEQAEADRARLRATLDSLLDPHAMLRAVRDASGRIVDFECTDANDTACAYTGRTRDRLLGTRLSEVLPGQAEAGLLELYAAVVDVGAPLALDDVAYRLDWLDGEVRFHDVRAARVGDSLSLGWRDVTDRHVAAARLAETAEQLRLVLDNTADVVILYGADGRVRWASPSLREVFGWSPDDVVGTEFRLAYEDDARAATEAIVQAMSERRDTVSYRSVARCADGSARWTATNARLSWNADGDIDFVVTSVRDITPQVMAEEALLEREERYRLLAENASDVVYRTDTAGLVRWMSPSALSVFGVAADDLLGTPARELIHPADRERVEAARAGVYDGVDVTNLLCRFRTAADEPRWMSVRAHPVRDDDGRVLGAVVALRDVHEQTLAREAERASAELFRTAMQSAVIGMALADVDGSFRVVNPALCRILGRPEPWLLSHRLLDVMHPDDKDLALREHERLLSGPSDVVVSELRLLRGDAATVWARRAAVRIRDADGEPRLVMLQVEDVTSEHQAREALTYQAFHDALTGLRNRAWILDILEVDLRTAKRQGKAVGVLFVDLDNFKVVNDSLGHAAGDEVLAVVADRIAGALRPSDRVGRFGGDEFVIVVPDLDDPQECEQIAARVSAAVAVELPVEGHRVVPTASIGIAMSKSTSTPESMLRDTDAALFRAKTAGRSRWRFFDDDMHAAAVARLTIEGQLRDAVARRQFVVHYQPIVCLADGEPVGHEALLRWAHPTRGILSPGEFLDVAEDSGLIVAIGRQVRDVVCARLAADSSLRGTVSVNLSAVELAQGDWLAEFTNTLDAHRVDPRRIVVEVTETAVLSLLDDVRRDLSELRDRGVGVHLDDFGTGFSSISVLRDLPVTGLKLDRTFVADLTATTSPSNALAEGLAGLVAGLHLTGIAEGIETAEQADILRDQGWSHGQGYHFGRPQPAQ